MPYKDENMRREHQREVYYKNREKIVAQKRTHRRENLEACRLRENMYNATHRAERKAYAEAYRRLHGDALNETERHKREEHPEDERQKDRLHYQAHKTEKNQRSHIYYREHRTEILKQKREYSRLRTVEIAVISERRKARKRQLPDTLTKGEWMELQERFNYSCAYCGNQEVKLTMDHVIPISKGGGTTKENIVPACLPCNVRKGNRLL